MIFVANQCSRVDTPMLLRSLPAKWRRSTALAVAANYFYTKRLPANTASLALGTVPLERRPPAWHGHHHTHIKNLIDSGWSLIVSPRGRATRRRVGLMRAGRPVLVAEHGVPITPVHMSATDNVMPSGRSWLIRREGGGHLAQHTISEGFGHPIHVGPRDNRLEVMERVRVRGSLRKDTPPDPNPAARRAAATAKTPRRRVGGFGPARLMARVLLTGGSGFIGGELATGLLTCGEEVVGLARTDTSARALATRGARVVRGDGLPRVASGPSGESERRDRRGQSSRICGISAARRLARLT